MLDVVAIVNPIARRHADAMTALTTACRGRGHRLTIVPTTPDAPGGPQARAALADGADLVIAAGGDGTVRAVAHELAGSDADLAVLPLGTANLFARNLGLAPGDVSGGVRAALDAPARVIDVGQASWTPASGSAGARETHRSTFLVVAGLGNDAATVLATRPEFKSRFGWLAYFESGARHLGRPAVRMRVSVDGGLLREVSTWCLLAGNAGRLPGGVRVFPDAALDSGRLATLLVPLASPRQWAGVALQGLTRHRVQVEALEYGQARSVWAIPETPTALQLDGDVVGSVSEVRLAIAAASLRVRASGDATAPAARREDPARKR